MAGMLAAGVVLVLASSPVVVADALQDRVEINWAVDRLFVDVYRAKGIAHAELRRPESQWPAAVIVRLHGFQELESFTATSGAARLECALVRPEGQHPLRECRLGDGSVDALRRERDDLELELPPGFLAASSGCIAIHWVDQWR